MIGEGDKLSKVADGSLIGLILIAPIAAGSWRIEVLPLLVGMALVGLGALVLQRRAEGRALHLHGITCGLLLLGAYTAFQAMPLPAAVLSRLSPTAFELRSFVLADGAGSISYETSATLREAAKLCLYAIVVILAHEGTRRRKSSDLVTQPVLYAGLAVSGVGLLHRALGIERLFGIFDTSVAVEPMITTFVNPNHAAGFMTLSVLTGLGLAASERPRHLRVAALAGVLGCFIMSMILLSRGGLVSLALGAALFTVMYRLRHERSNGSPWLIAGLLVISVVTLVSGLMYGSERLGKEITDNRGSIAGLPEKLAAVKDAIPMAQDHLITGIGRGAYVTAYTRYKTSPLQLTFAFPENIVAQLLSEWGLLLGALALLGLVAAIGLRLLRTTHVSSLGALAGVLALVVQNLVDFSLEMPGVAIPVAAILGAVASRQIPTVRLRSWALPLSAAMACALVLLTLGAFATGDLASDTAMVRARHAPAGEVQALPLSPDECDALMQRHPASGLLAANAAYALEISTSTLAIRWANRALYLAPTYADGHVITGRLLLRAGRRVQGLGELRRAWALVGGNRAPLMAQIVALVRGPDEIALAVPRRDEALDRIDVKQLTWAVRYLMQTGRHEWARALVAHHGPLEELLPNELLVLSAAASLVGEEVLAIEAASRRVEMAPGDRDSLLLQAKLLLSSASPQAAWDVLARIDPDPDDPAPVLRLRFRAAMALKDYPRGRAVLDQMRKQLAPNQKKLLELAGLEADLETEDGHTAQALSALDHALTLEPSDTTLRYRRAVLLKRDGRLQEAKVDAEFVLRREPGHAAARRLLTALGGS